MTLDEAAGHVGNPVLCRDVWPKVREGVVRAVSEGRGLVRVEMRLSGRSGWRMSGRCEWWAPGKLAVPQWWSSPDPVRPPPAPVLP